MDIVEDDLVRGMLAGDESAFELFSERYLPALYRFASRRLSGDRELTREIVQTTACKAIGKLDSYRGDAALMTWLGSICRNEIAMHFRRQHRRREVEWSPELEATASANTAILEPDAEASLIRDERVEWVHATLDLMPPHYAQALEWKYIDNLSVKQIAERLEVGLKAAESLLTRARSSFRAWYDRHADVRSNRSGEVVQLQQRAASKP